MFLMIVVLLHNSFPIYAILLFHGWQLLFHYCDRGGEVASSMLPRSAFGGGATSCGIGGSAGSSTSMPANVA